MQQKPLDSRTYKPLSTKEKVDFSPFELEPIESTKEWQEALHTCEDFQTPLVDVPACLPSEVFSLHERDTCPHHITATS